MTESKNWQKRFTIKGEDKYKVLPLKKSTSTFTVYKKTFNPSTLGLNLEIKSSSAYTIRERADKKSYLKEGEFSIIQENKITIHKQRVTVILKTVKKILEKKYNSMSRSTILYKGHCEKFKEIRK